MIFGYVVNGKRSKPKVAAILDLQKGQVQSFFTESILRKVIDGVYVSFSPEFDLLAYSPNSQALADELLVMKVEHKLSVVLKNPNRVGSIFPSLAAELKGNLLSLLVEREAIEKNKTHFAHMFLAEEAGS